MKVFRLLTLVALCLLFAGNVFAAQHMQAQQNPQLYAGGKLGLMMLDESGTDTDDAINLGGVVGATVNQSNIGSLALEAELTFTVIDGDISFGPISADWDATTLAGYGVYRSNGPLYFKGKLGLAFWDASASGFGSDDGIDLSLGLGGGYRMNDKTALELEYTMFDSDPVDLDFLSIGFVVNF